MIDTILSMTWIDVLDILIVAFLIYRTMLLIKGTRAEQMLLGLAMIVIIYFLSQWAGLLTLRWILNNFLSSLILIIIVIFQHDIRRALAQIGRPPIFGTYNKAGKIHELEELIRATFALARERIGALMVLERNVGLKEYIEIGREVDAKLSSDMLLSIFHPSSPLHDGAVIIRGNRIVAAGCFLPLSTSPYIDRTLGTRHRAAIGISEETDAVVIVVSEERGEVSLAFGGTIRQNLDLPMLRRTLQDVFV